MSRLEVAIMVLVIALVAMIIFLGPKAKAAEWDANSDFFIYAEVAKAEEIPLPMPPAMMATTAEYHRFFGLNFPEGETLVFLGEDLLKQESGADKSVALPVSEIIRFNLALEGLRSFMIEAKKRGVSLNGLEFGLEPSLKAGRIREILPEGGGTIKYRMEGSFADENWRRQMLTALGGKEEPKKKK